MDSHISDQLQFSGFVSSRLIIRFVEGLERAAMRAAACVVTVGPVLSEVVRRMAPGARVLQLEDAPLQAAFREAPFEAERIRQEFNLGAAPLCVYTGNFESYQGVDLLVRAAGVVARERPDVRILLVGGTPQQVEQMRVLAAQCRAEQTCIFPGRRPAHEMAAFLTLADVLVTPRNRGTNPPMKIYAYMQSGRPIVSTNVPTHRQILDEQCAFLTEPDSESLAKGILAALSQPDKARGRAGGARAGRAEVQPGNLPPEGARDLPGPGGLPAGPES